MDLAGVIKSIESGGNPQAVRFEPGVYGWDLSPPNRAAIVERVRSIHDCSHGTAHALFSMSFGLFQLMGFNLYDPDQGLWSGTVFDYVNAPALQEATFQKFIEHHRIDFTLEELLGDPAKMELFVRTWNGPGDVDGYSARIRQHAGESP